MVYKGALQLNLKERGVQKEYFNAPTDMFL